ncbi:UbiA family prenyltransferase [Rhodocytophaga rosea]|uniref:UbiA family prenyltransferase n=1 Tax=Rhodocytophaga rosea TaxID=2704465 RepID=A0A6C0GCB3_9BACT|nr:UbiA family prenyltransferase [Rhodocytophaga rosea]QHT65596.1 UbiA family prenyltransferase [Rhodocytophaga rosea]
MIQRSTLLHLRIPFFFYLMPVFLFAWSISPQPELWRVLLAFFIVHFLLYPASNGYNSYYDKDEESIGGLEDPPPVSKELLYVSLLLDGIAMLLGIFLGGWFVLGLFIYGLVSKAYSDERIRLKKYAILSWFLAGTFQGAFTFLMVYQGINQTPVEELFQARILIPAGLTTFLLMGSYPMTQVYQHAEDARRGDMTLSRLLGIRGTFIFTAIVFMSSVAGYFYYFYTYYAPFHFLLFVVCLSPGLVFFLLWFYRVLKNNSAANFRSTMRLNQLTATGMNAFFVLFWVLIH